MGKGRKKNKGRGKTNTQGSGGGAAAAADKKADRRFKRERRAQQKKRGKGDLDAYTRAFRKYTQQVAAAGLYIRDMKGDGNCLFRSVADQLYSSEHRHDAVRQRLLDFVEAHRDDFEPFVEDDEDFDGYVGRMRQDGEWGGNFELAAVVRCFGVHIIVHQLAAPRLQLTNYEAPGASTIHVSYHDGEHYNSVRVLGDVAHEGRAQQVTSLKTIAAGDAAGDGAAAAANGAERDRLAQITQSTGCSNARHIREVLRDVEDDVDAAIEVLVAECAAGCDWDDEEEDDSDGGDALGGNGDGGKGGAEAGGGGGGGGGGGSGGGGAAAGGISGWDDAKFVPKPRKRVTNKERKAEARRLRHAKKLADAQERERRAEEEAARLRATQRKSGKKLTKKQKKEERRRQKMLLARGGGGDGVSGGVDALATLAI